MVGRVAVVVGVRVRAVFFFWVGFRSDLKK